MENYDLIGLGNPVMDIVIQVSDEELKYLGLEKGQCNLIDEDAIKKLESMIVNKDKKMVSGGSVANMVAIFSQLGGKASYIGKVGVDDIADKYGEDIKKIGAQPILIPSQPLTGRCLNFVTPDSERTMAVYLGAALTLSSEDINEEIITNTKYFQVAGYVLEEENLRNAVIKSFKLAKEKGAKISIDLADPWLVQRCGPVLKEIVKEYADILFANEEEAKELTKKETAQEALEELSLICDLVIVKIGKEGSLIKKRGEDLVTVKGFLVDAIDTTGAGDSYAGSFLYGLSQGFSLEKAGTLASYIASRVVIVTGARLESVPDYEHIFE